MAKDVIEDFDRRLSSCKDIHALFNFTELKQLKENESEPVILALLGNWTLCKARLSTTVAPSEGFTPTLKHPVFLTVYLASLTLFGLVVNLSVIGTICRVRRLWSITNAFVLSLAMADFLLASVLIPCIISELHYPGQLGVPKAIDTLFPLLGVASLLNLAAVTLERFMSISYPLTYDAYVTRFRATVIITAVWLVSFSQAFLRFAVQENGVLYEDIRFALAFALPFLCILIVNIKIYFVARQHARQINAANPQGPSRVFIRKLKTVKIIALLVGTFIVTWLPYFIVSIYDHHVIEDRQKQRDKIVLQVIEALVCATTLINPLMYGLLRKDVREAMVKGFKCQNVNQTEIQSFSYSFRTEKTPAASGEN